MGIILPLLGMARLAGAAGATLYLSPGTGSFLVGSTFDVSIILDTGEQAVNTVEVELKFPADKIQLVSPSVGRSIIQIWATQPSFSNKEGKIYFVGGIPSPGIKTSQGIITTMTFRVIAPGFGEMKFLEKNSVLANDGFGTNVLRIPKGASFNFNVPPPLGPQISSPTHPDETRWYKDPNPILTWARDSGVTGFSYSVDRDPNGFPDTKEDTSNSQVSFENLESGIWYFHLRARADGVWGGTSHYVLQIDTDIPAAFQVNVSPGKRTTTRNPILRFFTTDSVSGFDHFELKVVPLKLSSQEATPFFFEVSSPYQLTPLQPGRYAVIVRAYDKAGNWRDEEVPLNIISSLFQFFTSEGIDFVFFFASWSLLLIILALVIAGLILFTGILWWMHHPHIKGHAKEDYEKIKKLFAGKKKKNEYFPEENSFEFENKINTDKAPIKKEPITKFEKPEIEIAEIFENKSRGAAKPADEDKTKVFSNETETVEVFPLKEKAAESPKPHSETEQDSLADLFLDSNVIPVESAKENYRKEIIPEYEKSETENILKKSTDYVPELPKESQAFSGFRDKIRFLFKSKPVVKAPKKLSGIETEMLKAEEAASEDHVSEPTVEDILETAKKLETPIVKPEPLLPSIKPKGPYSELPFHSLYSWLLRKNGPSHLPKGLY